MKISFETKITAGYISNIVVVFVLGLIYWKQLPVSESLKVLDWVSLALLLLSLGMLTVVFFILKTQLKANKSYAQELEKNQKLLQAITANASTPISVKKLNGEYLLANTSYRRIFQFGEEDITGKTYHDLLPKELADTLRASDLETLKSNHEIYVEETLEQVDGMHTYLSVKFPLFDASNRVYAIGSISTDITERKKTEHSLKAADTFFTLSLDSLAIAYKTRFIKVNPSLCTLLGYTSAELLEKPFVSFIFPEDIALTEKKLKTLEKGSTLVNFKNRWVCKNGAVKWLSWNATMDHTTGEIYAIARDITKKLRVQESKERERNLLFENQQKLNMIIENISDGVLVANREKHVILANDNANALFGIEDDAQISVDFTPHFEVLFPDGETVFPVQNLPAERALAGEITDDIDVVLRDLSNGEMRRVLLSGRPILTAKHQVAAIVITIKDISRYKELEKELEEKDLTSRRMIGFKNLNKD
ncbi:MAG TPA: PAS domain S-box protein [Flavobacteriaceae bacterium]|nr:PAS domain S-box protein [Flavobacteriaceae bacterium]